jgi:hypothetical protein
MKITNVKVLKIDSMSRQKTAHCYFFLTGESILENLKNRRSRPTKEFKALLPEVFEKTEFNQLWKDGHIKASWSQNCGCSCGCSPGFRLTGLYGHNIFVDIKLEA